MAKRKRDVPVLFWVSAEELELIRQKMQQYGTENLSAYLRKMAVDGYVVQLDLPELKELVSLMRYSSNNLNQLTRKVHETGRVYDADLEDTGGRRGVRCGFAAGSRIFSRRAHSSTKRSSAFGSCRRRSGILGRAAGVGAGGYLSAGLCRPLYF